MNIDFTSFQEALEAAADAISMLKSEAEDIQNTMENIIDACETIESEL